MCVISKLKGSKPFVIFLFILPFSFAELLAVGRVNSPWTANLALRAWIARQGGSLATVDDSGTPSVFLGANELGRPFLATLLGCSKRVARQRGATRNLLE